MATLYGLCLRNSFKTFYFNQLEMTPPSHLYLSYSLYTLNICFSLYLSSNTVPNLPFVLMTDTWAFISDRWWSPVPVCFMCMCFLDSYMCIDVPLKHLYLQLASYLFMPVLVQCIGHSALAIVLGLKRNN